MNKILILLILSAFSVSLKAQTDEPQSKVLTVKKVVKVGTKFYIEESTTTTYYKELTADLLFETEKYSQDELNDKAEELKAAELSKQKKAERLERNKLLKDALKKGYEPDVRTLEEKQRVDKIKAKINSIK